MTMSVGCDCCGRHEPLPINGEEHDLPEGWSRIEISTYGGVHSVDAEFCATCSPIVLAHIDDTTIRLVFRNLEGP